ncbi:hypothetical protein C0Q70_07511 [Pomacea canaliculata]|uniref:MARVEL domain-containing protein n=1 Tax=Pomacea canaliculata TaxID=400727 RepID=A0A2T7PFA4_POMCA|nr:epithelial membrane protein 1-like [Pomacea canaliculata]PVD32083.1 hypothetical protein C0Q70_07511 [Pomacea canaliculata]
MACKVLQIPICVAIVCCGVAFIFQLVAVAGTGWLVISVGDNSEEVGLFRLCVNGVCTEYQMNDLEDWLKACQAFSILGLLTITGSLVLGILHFVLEDTAKVSVAGIASCAASVVFLIIELAVFGAETSSLRKVYNFGYGFILSVIACILSFVAAVLFAVGSRM